MDFDTPEGRAAALSQLGPVAYNRAHAEHVRDAILRTVAGHAIRSVPTRFGRLFAVGSAGRAFGTLATARAYANANPAEPGQ